MYAGYNQFLVAKSNKILFIKFNNIAKKNSISYEGYTELGRVLRTVAKDDTITVVVITGVGDYFCSGNDLSVGFSNEDIDAQIQRNNKVFREMLSSLIDCPKILVALVNGPAIGIGATISGLCDLIWCEEKAFFYTPFSKLGLVPEGCSSYLLPLTIGRSKATEMLLFSEKMTSEEALRSNFVSRVFKLDELQSTILPKLKEYSELPQSSMQTSKKLMRLYDREMLYKALDCECDELKKRFYNEEFINAMLDFANRKKKSKL